eukprot:803860-Pyramimonas_sp.AAC.1
MWKAALSNAARAPAGRARRARERAREAVARRSVAETPTRRQCAEREKGADDEVALPSGLRSGSKTCSGGPCRSQSSQGSGAPCEEPAGGGRGEVGATSQTGLSQSGPLSSCSVSPTLNPGITSHSKNSKASSSSSMALRNGRCVAWPPWATVSPWPLTLPTACAWPPNCPNSASLLPPSEGLVGSPRWSRGSVGGAARGREVPGAEGVPE